jgi:hypothetical protein
MSKNPSSAVRTNRPTVKNPLDKHTFGSDISLVRQATSRSVIGSTKGCALRAFLQIDRRDDGNRGCSADHRLTWLGSVENTRKHRRPTETVFGILSARLGYTDDPNLVRENCWLPKSRSCGRSRKLPRHQVPMGNGDTTSGCSARSSHESGSLSLSTGTQSGR